MIQVGNADYPYPSYRSSEMTAEKNLVVKTKRPRKDQGSLSLRRLLRITEARLRTECEEVLHDERDKSKEQGQ